MRDAIKAFRKTNRMARTFSYSAGIFRDLLSGKGAFEPRHKDGRHVEVDILDLVDDTLALFKAKAREKGLELVALADPAAPRIVPADPVGVRASVAEAVSAPPFYFSSQDAKPL